MAAKLQTKIEKVTARAGIFCAESYFYGFQLDKLLVEALGVRSKAHNGFQWDEVVLPLFDTCLCGGDYLEDMNEIGKDLRLAPGARVPSSDTVGRTIKQLAVDNISYTAKCSGQSYAFNTNPKLNGLLMESAIRMGLLKRGGMVDVDFDHVFIPCDKSDAKYSYKQAYGIFAGSLFIPTGKGVLCTKMTGSGHQRQKVMHAHDMNALGRRGTCKSGAKSHACARYE